MQLWESNVSQVCVCLSTITHDALVLTVQASLAPAPSHNFSPGDPPWPQPSPTH